MLSAVSWFPAEKLLCLLRHLPRLVAPTHIGAFSFSPATTLIGLSALGAEMTRSRTGSGDIVPVHVVGAPPAPGKPTMVGTTGKGRSVEEFGDDGGEGWRLTALPHTSEARSDVAS